MQERHARTKKHSDASPDQIGESILESPGEVVVAHHPTPPKTRSNKQIHPRRPLPLVPTGPPRDRDDNNKA